MVQAGGSLKRGEMLSLQWKLAKWLPQLWTIVASAVIGQSYHVTLKMAESRESPQHLATKNFMLRLSPELKAIK